MTRRLPHAVTLFPLLAGLALALAGCLGSSPKIVFHTLSVEALEVSAPGDVASRVRSLGVGPIRLPELLEKPGVVIRKDDYTVEQSLTHEWGSRLSDELLRALKRLLERALPNTIVRAVPWENAQAPELQVTLTVDRFDASPAGKAVLRGTWILQDPKDGTALAIKRVSLEEEVADDTVEAVVEAQSKLVLKLGEAIVRGLGRTPRPEEKPRLR